METRTAAGVRFWVLLGLVSRLAGLKDDGGGWYGESDFRLEDEGPCNLDVLDASELSHQQFLDRYAFSRPLVLRGLTDNTRFRLLCSRSSLLRDYGSRRVKLSTANTHSYRKVEVPFQEYVDVHLRPQSADALGSDTLYFFGDNNFTEWQSLFQQYEPPPYVLPHTSGAYSFGIAGQRVSSRVTCRHVCACAHANLPASLRTCTHTCAHTHDALTQTHVNKHTHEHKLCCHGDDQPRFLQVQEPACPSTGMVRVSQRSSTVGRYVHNPPSCWRWSV
uniref:Jumonji domain containing 8 n=1 Tax=Oryzias latipes TaxID=8090 RepID=A0A3P9J6B9_ORYLA